VPGAAEAGAAAATTAATQALSQQDTPEVPNVRPRPGEDRSAALAGDRERRRRGGRASTILTSPLGLPGSGNVGVKTLLGQ